MGQLQYIVHSRYRIFLILKKSHYLRGFFGGGEKQTDERAYPSRDWDVDISLSFCMLTLVIEDTFVLICKQRVHDHD